MADSKPVRLGITDYRISSFDAGIEGVSPIASVHAGGTEVDGKHVEVLREAAEKEGIKLKKM